MKQTSLYINQNTRTEPLAEDTGRQPRGEEMAFMRDVVQKGRWVTGLDHYQRDAV